MKIISTLTLSLFMCSCWFESDVDVFIRGLNCDDIKNITLTDMSGSEKIELRIANSREINVLCSLLKNSKRVAFRSVNPRPNDSFFLVNVQIKDDSNKEIELFGTLKGEGVILTHTGQFYLQNDSLLYKLKKRFNR